MQPSTESRFLVRPDDRVVEGVVSHGDKRGRLLGFPTANIPGDTVGLDDGVWAGTVQLDPEDDGPEFAAAISLGSRPTYYAEDGVRLIEAFLLGFDDQIYGRRVRVTFMHCLRPQWGFASSRHLVEQLQRDVADVEAWVRQREALLTGRRLSGQVQRRGRTGRRRHRDREHGSF